jgi:hypothetical protein
MLQHTAEALMENVEMNTSIQNEKAINFLKHYKRGFRDGKNNFVQLEGAGEFYKRGYAEGQKYLREVVAKLNAAAVRNVYGK